MLVNEVHRLEYKVGSLGILVIVSREAAKVRRFFLCIFVFLRDFQSISRQIL